MTPADTIQVFNTTLRDGAQREGIKLCVEDSGRPESLQLRGAATALSVAA